MTPEELRRGGWRMMRRSLRPSVRWIVVGVTASLVWTAGKVAVPLFAQRAIDQGIEPFHGGALFRWTAAVVVVTVVVALTTGLRRYSAFALSLRSETDLRSRLFAHLQRLHFGYHDRSHTGQLMSRANTDLRQIQLFLVFVPVAAANVVMIVAVGVVLFAIDARLAAVALVSLPFLNVAATRFSRRLHPETMALQQRLAGVAEVVEESVSGVRVVKGFGAEAHRVRHLRDAADRVYEKGVAIGRLRATFTPLMDLLPTIGLVAVLGVGGRDVVAGRLTIGELIAFNFYILQLIFPLRLTAILVAASSRASAAASRVYEVLATAPEIVDHPHAGRLPDGGGEVRFDHVQFGYAPGALVLDDFDLVVPAGTSVALVGPTGAGKSTVARLIPRFYDVDGGRVLIDGVDVRDVRLGDVRGAVGTVFEDTFLFTDTVRTNIAFADPEAPLERVRWAAGLAGADDFVTGLSDGYDTILGERGFSLSGGQRQRIAIARAILADPRMLVLDDATSSVDPTKEHEIRAALAEVMRGRTTIIIAHRPATVALADRVVLVDEGRVLAEGTHEELLATSASYREVLARDGEERSGAPGADDGAGDAPAGTPGGVR